MCSNLSCYQLSSGMCSNLSCYQLKADYYIHKMLYMNLYCNHKTKFLIHKIKWGRNSNITLKRPSNYKGRERRKKEQKGTTKTARKQLTNDNKYLSIITLNVNGLSSH